MPPGSDDEPATLATTNRRAAEPLRLDPDAALIVVDVQAAFDDPWWGPRNNPAADDNIATLVSRFTDTDRPVVIVRHDSTNPDSPLYPSLPGNRLKGYLTGVRPNLLVTKTVNSSFHGAPDLHDWLRAEGIHQLVVCGITTNHCCETTARVGGNLGYDVLFALDATYTFDRAGPDGVTLSAEELARATAASLHDEFGTVVTTLHIIAASMPAA